LLPECAPTLPCLTTLNAGQTKISGIALGVLAPNVVQPMVRPMTAMIKMSARSTNAIPKLAAA
jgi:hypothetical protein